jgi:hypothetical protein
MQSDRSDDRLQPGQTALSHIGRKLEKQHANVLAKPLPSRLRELVAQLDA